MAHITKGVFENGLIHNVYYLNGDTPAVGDYFNATVVKHLLLDIPGKCPRFAKKITIKDVGTIGNLMKSYKGKIVNADDMKIHYKSNGKKWVNSQNGVIAEWDDKLFICHNYRPYGHGPRADGTIMWYDPEDEFIA